MSFLDSVSKFFTKQANTGIFGFFNAQTMPRMGEKEYLLAYRGWVYACVNSIAQSVADTQLKLQTKNSKGEWQDVVKSPVLDLLYFVNLHTTYSDMLYATQAYLELDGNAFWYVPKNKNGNPTEIWVLDPTKVKVVKSAKEFISGYTFKNDKGEEIPFEASEIIHFKHFNPNNPYRGMGTVEAAGIAIDIDTYASEWQRNFFGNSAMPSAILSAEGQLSQEQYDRIKANWDTKFKGVQNAHKMALLEGGMKFTPLSPTAKEMEFAQSRKDIRDEIMAIFRVSKTILGITEEVNYASAQAAEYVYTKHVIKPKINFIVDRLNEFLLPLFNINNQETRLSYVDPTPENAEQQVTMRQSAIQNGYMTPNEARAEIGKKPLDGGDILYMPMNMIPLGSTPQYTDPAQPQKTIKIVKKKSKSKFKTDKGFINTQSDSLKAKYLEHNTALKELILSNLEKKKSIRKAETDSLTAGEIIALMFEGVVTWTDNVYSSALDAMKPILGFAGNRAIDALGVDVSFDVENPRAVKWVTEHALEDSQSYTDSIKDAMTDKLTTVIDEGGTINNATKLVEDFFDEESDWRALRIARTETITSYNAGSLEGYKQSNVVAGKEWLPDAEACPICQSNADAGVIGLDADFPSGDQQPSAHPNCECTLLPVVRED